MCLHSFFLKHIFTLNIIILVKSEYLLYYIKVRVIACMLHIISMNTEQVHNIIRYM